MEIAEPLVYKVLGLTAQILEVSIEPNQTIIADGGLLLYLDEEIVHETRPDDGFEPEKLASAGKGQESLEEDIADDNDLMPEVVALPTKAVSKIIEEDEDEAEGTFLEKLWKATRKTISNIGTKIQESTGKKEVPAPAPEPEAPKSFGGVFEEPPAPVSSVPEPIPEPEPIFSWFLTHLHNPSEYMRKVGFTTTHGGLVVPIELDDLAENAIIFQTGAFLCARKGVQLEKFLDTGISVNFTQGKLFKLDKITGSGCMFLRGEGQVITKTMENDAIRLNLFSLLAYESTLSLDTKQITLTDAMNYEDQTQFALLSGTGRYWLQTANLQHLVYRLSPVVFEPETPKTPDLPAPAPQKAEIEEDAELDIDKIVEEM